MYLFSVALCCLASLKELVGELVVSDGNSGCCNLSEVSNCGFKVNVWHKL